MDLSPILTHLKAQLSAYRLIGGAVDLAAAQDGRVTAPAAYLIPLSEEAGDLEFSGDNLQAITVRFAVIIALSNRADTQGGAALSALEPRRDDIKAALIGWSPAPQYAPISFMSGQHLAFVDGLLWWSDEFKTRYILRAPDTQ